ncbi:ATP-binding protein, partial [Streptomyces anulatus]|uniref:ATP-binding protein n=1 Tax=Streptomyces anulatus TaxID=1892 RepID=UPI003498B0B0
MAARLLAMLMGAFADRPRTMTNDAVDLSRPDLGWSPHRNLASPDHPVISRRFKATPDQVRLARNFVAEMLGESHPFRDDAMLLTSELATNAVEHPTGLVSGPREFLVTVTFVVQGVLITVQDPGSLRIP